MVWAEGGIVVAPTATAEAGAGSGAAVSAEGGSTASSLNDCFSARNVSSEASFRKPPFLKALCLGALVVHKLYGLVILARIVRIQTQISVVSQPPSIIRLRRRLVHLRQSGPRTGLSNSINRNPQSKTRFQAAQTTRPPSACCGSYPNRDRPSPATQLLFLVFGWFPSLSPIVFHSYSTKAQASIDVCVLFFRTLEIRDSSVRRDELDCHFLD